ncbi:basic proline-rich protein-like [Passer montanus]|uniref:basic proline-rich protein-like n=1 Tax=Passer montanus TaxID=9160 RepID=UPI0019602934|nr:basic proline-rich protein-like [Passer montanus]
MSKAPIASSYRARAHRLLPYWPLCRTNRELLPVPGEAGSLLRGSAVPCRAPARFPPPPPPGQRARTGRGIAPEAGAERGGHLELAGRSGAGVPPDRPGSRGRAAGAVPGAPGVRLPRRPPLLLFLDPRLSPPTEREREREKKGHVCLEKYVGQWNIPCTCAQEPGRESSSAALSLPTAPARPSRRPPRVGGRRAPGSLSPSLTHFEQHPRVWAAPGPHPPVAPPAPCRRRRRAAEETGTGDPLPPAPPAGGDEGPAERMPPPRPPGSNFAARPT